MVRVVYYLYSTCNIAFTEGPVSLNWVAIMKTVRENTVGFYQEGGWEFLQEQSVATESEESGSDFGEVVSELEELEEDEDSESSEVSEHQSSQSSMSEMSEEGLDWDELENKARADDERKNRHPEEEEEEQPRRKKSKFK